MTSAKEAKIKSLLADYAAKRPEYEAFAAAVGTLLESLLRKEGIKYLSVPTRAKTLTSFEQRIREKTPPSRIEERKDLAGSRVILYLESDIGRLVPIVQEEFEVIRERDQTTLDGYNAYHLWVKLKSPRKELPEYASFAELECEIQLTTGLFHAWSELSHDLIYKDQEQLARFSPEAYSAIEREFAETMRDHIKVATRRFETISRMADRIREGKQILDVDFLDQIPRLATNDEMYSRLEMLNRTVREYGIDKTPEEIQLLELLRSAMQNAKRNKRQSILSVYGRISGKTAHDVILKCLDILDAQTVKYNHFRNAFELLLSLGKTRNETVKQKVLESIRDLSKYEYHILKQVNYVFQKELVDHIDAKTDKELKTNLPLLVAALKEVLSPSFDGSSYEPKTMQVTFTSGSVAATDELTYVRAKSIELLTKLYGLATRRDQKISIIDALSVAAELPSHHKYSDELEALISANTQTVLAFLKNLLAIDQKDNRVLLRIEELIARLHRIYGPDRLPDLDSILDLLHRDEDYSFYRTLSGYRGRLAIDKTWQEEVGDLDKQITQYLSEITEENAGYWIERLVRVVDDYEPRDGSAIHLQTFLGRIGKEKSAVALRLVSEREERLGNFLTPLLIGLLEGGSESEVRVIVASWLEQRRNLVIAASVLRILNDLKLSVSVLDAAIVAEDYGAIEIVAHALVSGYEQYDRFEARKHFIRAVTALAQSRRQGWVGCLTHPKTFDTLLEELSETETEKLLGSLISQNRIDYEAENILSVIAKDHANKVIEFLYGRIGEHRKRGGYRKNSNYDAIPYSIGELRVVLALHADVVIPSLLSWFSNSHPTYGWEASRLLAEIFPSIEPPLQNALESLIDKGEKSTVLNILRQYKGEPFVFGICSRLASKFGEAVFNELGNSLIGTGVVSGEYGLVEAYKQKKSDSDVLQNDPDSKVRAFHDHYKRMLDRMIQREQKRADDENAFLRAGL